MIAIMIDMRNTFPYFLVKNEKVETEVPSIICPSEDGSYYKDEWLGHKTPKRFIHVAMMQSLGGDRTCSKHFFKPFLRSNCIII